jgi:hypothetical protein
MNLMTRTKNLARLFQCQTEELSEKAECSIFKQFHTPGGIYEEASRRERNLTRPTKRNVKFKLIHFAVKVWTTFRRAAILKQCRVQYAVPRVGKTIKIFVPIN